MMQHGLWRANFRFRWYAWFLNLYTQNKPLLLLHLTYILKAVKKFKLFTFSYF